MEKQKRGGGNQKAIEVLKKANMARRYPEDKIFIENCSYARHHVKKKILDNDLISYECKICGIKPIWNGKPMPLILDHINGICNDNRLENLRFVCSNCDSQLDTYKARNINRASR